MKKKSIGSFLAGLLFLSSAAAMAMPPGADSLTKNSLAQTATKKKKSKKKKRADDSGMTFGPDDVGSSGSVDSGVGVHREQEGVDVPYKAEVALLTDLSFMSKKVGDNSPTSESNLGLAVEWMFVVGSFEVGPDVSYNTSESSFVTTAETVKFKTTNYAVGGLFKWNFADLNHADLVPFAYGGVAYRAAESKSGDSDATKSSGSVLKAGGGLNIFLDSNVAFNPRAEYRIETDKSDASSEAVETTTSGFKILIGIASFI